MKKILEKYSKYLPSKKFAYLIATALGLCLVFFLIFNFSPQKKFFFFAEKKTGLQNENLTINNILQQDADGDGVADWEEALWGTDKNNKTTYGIPDLAYIANKKKELKIDDVSKDTEELTETEKFAREFFATYVAMKEAGGDPSTINNFATTLGEKISYPSLIDSYTEKDVKITNNDNDDEAIVYYLTLKLLFEKYEPKGMGTELSMIASTLDSSEETTTPQNGKNLNTVSEAYQDFAKKMMDITVPQSFVSDHLAIANSANNTGISITSMTKIANDPIIGLSGISQYQKYNNEFIQASQEIVKKIKTLEEKMMAEENAQENKEGSAL